MRASSVQQFLLAHAFPISITAFLVCARAGYAVPLLLSVVCFCCYPTLLRQPTPFHSSPTLNAPQTVCKRRLRQTCLQTGGAMLQKLCSILFRRYGWLEFHIRENPKPTYRYLASPTKIDRNSQASVINYSTFYFQPLLQQHYSASKLIRQRSGLNKGESKMAILQSFTATDVLFYMLLIVSYVALSR